MPGALQWWKIASAVPDRYQYLQYTSTYCIYYYCYCYFQPLAIPGRVLVGEGVLTKMCRKRPKARQFFLFNDILVYGNIVIGKKKYNKQHIIPLEEVQLQGLEDNGRTCYLCMIAVVWDDLFQYRYRNQL